MVPPHGVRSNHPTVAFGLAAGSCAVLAVLALVGLAIDGDAAGLDRRILLALRSAGDGANPIGLKWLQGYMRDVTALGGFGVLSLVVLGVAGFLAATGRRIAAMRVFAISFSGWLAMNAVKLIVQRPRPDLVPHGAEVYASSFPSGHAMSSAVVYLTLAGALAQATSDPRARAYAFGLASALIALIGVSRVYLGVHWPSDVLGGWALGAFWAGAAGLACARLERLPER
ncbi:MAG: phosphatase PAP2 family protein [Hyphomicrobium sp.]